MNKLLKELIEKNFSIYLDGKFERKASFVDLMDLLLKTTDFYDLTIKQRMHILQYGIEHQCFEFDDGVSIRFKN